MFPKKNDSDAPRKWPWKLLIVDDEPEVHSVTRLSLSDFRFQGRNLEFISAYSGEEAKSIVQQDPEIAVILLDVVMETDDAGLKVVEFIRQNLGNNFVRIILRTGHPGLAPERRVIQAYDINDYRAKVELTQDRMFSVMHTSLAAYQHLTSLACNRRYLSTLSDEYRHTLVRLHATIGAPTQLLDQASKSLRAELEDKTSPEQRQQWARLEDSSNRLQNINRALERLTEGGMIAGPATEFSGDEMVQGAIDDLQALIEKTGHSIAVEKLPRLQGYPQQFKLMMENLLRNALQHHEGHAEPIKVSVKAKGAYWQISVADRGKGVRADRREDIFEAFVSAPQSDSESRDGIGLVICRRIAALHGGRIWVEERPGGGSVFVCKIPAQGSLHEPR